MHILISGNIYIFKHYYCSSINKYLIPIATRLEERVMLNFCNKIVSLSNASNVWGFNFVNYTLTFKIYQNRFL